MTGFFKWLFRRKTPFLDGLGAEEYQFHVNSFVTSLQHGKDNPHALAFQEHMLTIIKEGRPADWGEEKKAIDVTPREQIEANSSGMKFKPKENKTGQISWVREDE